MVMPVLAALGATGVLSAVGGFLGARQTNSAQDARQQDAQRFNAYEAQVARDFNAAEAEKQRVWSAGQAERQMDFQERLSGTAYQRAMSDMRSAGLNPILAYAQGGASTPGGAMGTAGAATSSAASSPSPQPVINRTQAASQAASAFLSNAQQLATIGSIEAQTEKAKAEAEYTRTQDRHLKTDFFMEPPEDGKWGPGVERSYTSQQRQYSAGLMYRQAATEAERVGLTREQTNLVLQEIKNAMAENRRIEATTGNLKADTVLRTLRVNEEQAGSAFWGKYPGMYGVHQGLKALGGAASSALDLSRAVRPFGLR